MHSSIHRPKSHSNHGNRKDAQDCILMGKKTGNGGDDDMLAVMMDGDGDDDNILAPALFPLPT